MNRKLSFAFFAAVLSSCLICLCGCSYNYTSSNYWNGVAKDEAYVNKIFPQPKKVAAAVDETVVDYSESAMPFKNGVEKFKIGVVISGDYWEFYDNFKALIEGFTSIGWMKRVVIPDSYKTVGAVFELLSQTVYSEYIEFSPEYFVNLDWGDNEDYFNKKYVDSVPDVDVIMAYGGMAAKNFYKFETYPVPVLSDAITDSFEAGITVSIDDSGRNFFSGKIDPTLYQQQIKIFRETTGFKKLGIVYGDDDYGRIYGAVSAVEEAAAELGFDIVRNTNVKEECADDTTALYLAALRDVASRSDAVYIGASTAVTEYDIMPQIVDILNEYKIPSFSLEGSIRVKDGILYSFSAKSLTRSGIWVATKISHIFNGVSPDKLSQRFENAASMAINMKTAKIIDYKVPLEILSSSDEIYMDYGGTSLTLSTDLDSVLIDENKIEFLPRRKSDGSPYKVGIIVSGEYWEFADHLAGIVSGLRSLGWIRDRFELTDTSSVSAIFEQLSKSSDYIEFSPSYFLNLDWGVRNMDRARALTTNKDVDLLLVFGGVAAKLVSGESDLCVPALIEAVTDPIGSKIIYSTADSGNNFITCRVDPTQYVRQLEMFHDLIGFKKLGIVYGDNDDGRQYSAVNDVELVALECGFEIVRNTNVKEVVAPDTADLYLKAIRDIAGKVDAVYIGASTAVTEYDITSKIADILNEYKVPTFSLEGEIRVKDGILMGMSSVEAENIGLYNANKIAAIFYDVIPRLLSQEFTGFPSIAINLDTAKKLELDFPLETLAAIDKLYMGEQK